MSLLKKLFGNDQQENADIAHLAARQKANDAQLAAMWQDMLMQSRLTQTLKRENAELRENLASLEKRVEEIEHLNEALTHLMGDTAEQTKKHECQLAGVWSWREKVMKQLATLKGTT